MKPKTLYKSIGEELDENSPAPDLRWLTSSQKPRGRVLEAAYSGRRPHQYHELMAFADKPGEKVTMVDIEATMDASAISNEPGLRMAVKLCLQRHGRLVQP